MHRTKLTDKNNPAGPYDFDIIGDADRFDKKSIANFANNFADHYKSISSQLNNHPELKNIYATCGINKTPKHTDFSIGEIMLTTSPVGPIASIDFYSPTLDPELGYHTLTVEYDIKNKKLGRNIAMNG